MPETEDISAAAKEIARFIESTTTLTVRQSMIDAFDTIIREMCFCDTPVVPHSEAKEVLAHKTLARVTEQKTVWTTAGRVESAFYAGLIYDVLRDLFLKEGVEVK